VVSLEGSDDCFLKTWEYEKKITKFTFAMDRPHQVLHELIESILQTLQQHSESLLQISQLHNSMAQQLLRLSNNARKDTWDIRELESRLEALTKLMHERIQELVADVEELENLISEKEQIWLGLFEILERRMKEQNALIDSLVSRIEALERKVNDSDTT
jgi:DNA repair exonuclease SbcCD ATPase subunit